MRFSVVAALKIGSGRQFAALAVPSQTILL
jgi:hypothetical protein